MRGHPDGESGNPDGAAGRTKTACPLCGEEHWSVPDHIRGDCEGAP